MVTNIPRARRGFGAPEARRAAIAGMRFFVLPALFGAVLFAVAPLAGARAASDTVAQRLLDSHNEPRNWLNHHAHPTATRFSPLDRINRDNVKHLKVAWTLALGGAEGGGIFTSAGLTATPIVEDGFMYVTNGWGVLYKIDLKGGAGRLAWKMDPEVDRDWAGAVICCGVNNRGPAIWRDKVVSHAIDGRLILTDKDSGKVVWQREVANPDLGETITAAPLIVHDLAISGVSGGEFGVRGWLAATDLTTGREAWRTYTIPAPGEPGFETWSANKEAWKTGGGPTWVTGSYDAGQNLILWGVGNPAPDWDPEYRPGDNLYTESVLALDADSGEIRWHFQFVPNDPYDYDAAAEQVLVDIDGRKLVLSANRNGFVYALDRISGKFLWASQFVKKLTWTRGIDPATGKPVEYDPNSPVQAYAPGTVPTREAGVGTICPGNMGGKNWPPVAYHEKRQLLYIPVIESCNQLINEPVEPGSFVPREWFTGGGLRQHVPISGSLVAVDVRAGRLKARHETPYPLLGGVLATAGDLVFFGHASGEFVAHDAETLKELWRFSTGQGLNAPPITYMVAGKQYVAIAAGAGGAWPHWFVSATKGLEKLEPGAVIYAFELPDGGS